MWPWLRSSRAVRSQSRSRFTPAFEQLETRLPLAGNLSASVSAGNLIVTGNNAGAEFVIGQDDADQFTLIGMDTTVNGSTEPVTFSGVTHDLRIYLGKGDDAVTFAA